MRILMWHGWVLEGAGSNVHAARVTAVLRRRGHDVLLLCQEPHPERFPFLDGWGAVSDHVGEIEPTGAAPASGRATMLRPYIGKLLPVFVYDEYEGFEVKRFVDLSNDELDVYLERNVQALRAAAAWYRPDVVVMGHAVPGPVVARRALGQGYVAKIHGSDLEYAVRVQERYRELAREGLEGAKVVMGPSRDVLARMEELVPGAARRTALGPPGVDVDRFRPRNRRQALEEAAEALGRDPETARGRPSDLDAEALGALSRRDAHALHRLAGRYDQGVPDPDAGGRLRSLAEYDGPLVGYIGKFISQKGAQHLLAAMACIRTEARVLVVGFGLFREWLTALVGALDAGDLDAVGWLDGSADLGLSLPPDTVRGAAGIAERVTFTGRLDHRYAPYALAAMDVLVIPSILDEAFAMVTVEGAAAGALPLVAHHSGLGEVAGILENEVGRPGLFSYEPGPGSVERLAEGLDRLLGLRTEEREELRQAAVEYVGREWTWERTADRLLEAAGR